MSIDIQTGPPAVDVETQEIYRRVANLLATRLHQVFQTEDHLRALYAEYLSETIEFDRTERWNNILRMELRKIWRDHGPEVKSNPTQWDTWHILCELVHVTDFNLFTQAFLNLQPYAMFSYRAGDADAAIAKLQAVWEGKSPSPFDAKPKMFKVAKNLIEAAYNQDLSTIKAMRIIAKSSPGSLVSFRVSPLGSTPTLVDSENLSMLGTGADQFLETRPGSKAFYFTWDVTPEVVTHFTEGKFLHPNTPYLFTSKSGDTTILNAALFAREVAFRLFRVLGSEKGQILSMLPRMNSVLVVVPEAAQADVEYALSRVQKEMNFPGIELHEGMREIKPKEAA